MRRRCRCEKGRRRLTGVIVGMGNGNWEIAAISSSGEILVRSEVVEECRREGKR